MLKKDISENLFSNSDTVTVKPVNNDHPWDLETVTVVDRWSLFGGSLYYTICNWAFKMVAFVAWWSLFRGDH